MASQVVAQLQNFQTSQKILISDTNCSICPETKTVPLAHTTNVDHAIFNTQHSPFLLVLVHRQGVEDLSRIFSRLCISIIQPSPLSSCNIIHFILILDYLHYPPPARPDVIFFRNSQDSVFITTICTIHITQRYSLYSFCRPWQCYHSQWGWVRLQPSQDNMPQETHYDKDTTTSFQISSKICDQKTKPNCTSVYTRWLWHCVITSKTKYSEPLNLVRSWMIWPSVETCSIAQLGLFLW